MIKRTTRIILMNVYFIISAVCVRPGVIQAFSIAHIRDALPNDILFFLVKSSLTDSILSQVDFISNLINIVDGVCQGA